VFSPVVAVVTIVIVVESLMTVVSVVIVSRVVVLESKSVSTVHTKVNVQDALHHPHSCLSTEVSTIDLINFVLFDKFLRQYSILEELSLMLCIRGMIVPNLHYLIALSYNLFIIVESLPNYLVSNIPQSLHPVAIAMDHVFSRKSQCHFCLCTLL
jgi:hypothetical protein